MTDIQLTDGSPVPSDRSHVEIDPATGMQKGYIVLTPEERAKGFVKRVRRSYIHERCGVETTMGVSIAETYARNPRFYSGTFCVSCRKHFPLVEFHWEDGEPMEPDLQDEWNAKRDEREAKRAHDRKEWRERRIADLRREIADLEKESP
jgi:hypothetical protein